MNNYTKRKINFITFIISIIIFTIINSFFHIVESHNNTNQDTKEEENIEVYKIASNIVEETPSILEESTSPEGQVVEDKKEWIIEIPIIGLKAEIAEGTTQEILNQYVGHFEDTQKQTGNIGLAAHNRGYKVNYFENVKKLKKGDEIHYKYNGTENIYVVDVIKVIGDTNWKYLKNTKENKITLITCVEDAPMYRRCIQGTQKN